MGRTTEGQHKKQFTTVTKEPGSDARLLGVAVDVRVQVGDEYRDLPGLPPRYRAVDVMPASA